MNPESIDLTTERARKAKLAKHLTKQLPDWLIAIAVILFAGGLALLILAPHHRYGLCAVAIALALYAYSLWIKWDLLALEPDMTSFNGRLSPDILVRLNPGDVTPRKIWHSISGHWQAYFFTNRLALVSKSIEPLLSDDPAELSPLLAAAAAHADRNHSPVIELGYLAAALLQSSPDVDSLLKLRKLELYDIDSIAGWLARLLEALNKKGSNYGGIGRDWAFGFTNFLNHFAHNISLEITKNNLNFGWLTDSEEVQAIERNLVTSAGAIVLIGPNGIGKTSRVYALAQRMMEGKADQAVAYHQILELDASTILSNASRFGGLENIFIRLANEAAHAGHVMLFLDDAQLFFNDASGSMNVGAILQPVLQSRSIQFILTMTPEDYQRLKTNNQTVANLLTPVILQELPEQSVMNILEDSALGLESRYQCLITFAAVKNAYRLSGRYNSEEAYPGKAIKLLEQSISYAQNKVVTDTSVDQAIEHITGVKVAIASNEDAGALLNLEEQIHKRMINQSEAVSSVASALRRSRAGVANPKRPVGSFLFLGPTGVGKTELAKAVAASYFGSEANLVRLDMSEYQQQSDVSRLLDAGTDTNVTFLMAVRRQPFSVVLLDEVEKANPAILNLLLQLLDEGRLTDVNGRQASFKDSVIIATSNAGANQIQARIKAAEKLEGFKDELTEQLIQQGIFKPELINRFDDVILFRPLNAAELAQVVLLLMSEVNKNLSYQNITVELSEAAVAKIVAIGSDERYGARPMRRALQRGVEDPLAKRILAGQLQPGQHLLLDASDLDLTS